MQNGDPSWNGYIYAFSIFAGVVWIRIFQLIFSYWNFTSLLLCEFVLMLLQPSLTFTLFFIYKVYLTNIICISTFLLRYVVIVDLDSNACLPILYFSGTGSSRWSSVLSECYACGLQAEVYLGMYLLKCQGIWKYIEIFTGWYNDNS